MRFREYRRSVRRRERRGLQLYGCTASSRLVFLLSKSRCRTSDIRDRIISDIPFLISDRQNKTQADLLWDLPAVLSSSVTRWGRESRLVYPPKTAPSRRRCFYLTVRSFNFRVIVDQGKMYYIHPMRLPILRQKLISIARLQNRHADIAHDFRHTLRVLYVVEKISQSEKADREVTIPAALFHDAVISRKHTPLSRSDSQRSAHFALRVLHSIQNYPSAKIPLVYQAIRECSFTKGIQSNFLEGKILQDADRLDTVGALGILRAIATAGQLQIQFYNSQDPFCQNRKPTPKDYAIDFFYARSLQVTKSMQTKTSREMARQRVIFLKKFLHQLKDELVQIEHWNYSHE